MTAAPAEGRGIRQPGPALEPRIVAVPGRARAFGLTLKPGETLLEGVRRGFAAEGFASGALDVGGLALGPFAYVMPALSTDGANAAFYSDIFRPQGVSRIEAGAMSFGRRDGAAFFHCHALWREADSRLTGGHVLPAETRVAERVTLNAIGIAGARFEADHDPETNFTLFGPVASAGESASGAEAHLLRLRPNQDFTTAIEAFCKERGIASARIGGGVGSLIGARFVDAPPVDNFATEIFISGGSVAPGPAGELEAAIEIGLVDFTGAVARGRLERGRNPVLMTFELMLLPG